MGVPLFIRLDNKDGETRFIRASTVTELRIDARAGGVFNLALHIGEDWENVAGYRTRKEAEQAVALFLDVLEGRAAPEMRLPAPLEEVFSKSDPLCMYGPTYRVRERQRRLSR